MKWWQTNTPKGLHPIAQGKRSATLGKDARQIQTLKGFHKDGDRRGSPAPDARPFIEPLQGSFRMARLPRVALRLPWAVGCNPVGVDAVPYGAQFKNGLKYLALALTLALVALAPLPATAQPPDVFEPFRGRDSGRSADVFVDDEVFRENNVPYDGRFTFVRLRYTPDSSGRGRGGGYFGGINFWWDHDYPRAERNFMRIVDELTAVDANTEGHNILAVGDPEIFKYPVAMVVEPGHLTLTEDEAANLRAYLLKGGFLIFDDFAGERDLANFADHLRMILPDAKLVPLTSEHPIFHSFFDIDSLDFYHPYRGLPSTFLGVYEDNDPEKRLLIVANYNNDIMESWEFSDSDFIPIELSNVAYKLGVNYVVYAMTH